MELEAKDSMNKPVEEPKTLTDVIKSSTKILPLVAGVIAILAPLGYLIGLGYHSGYLNEFGVPTSAFPLSITDGYVNAYYVTLFYVVDIFGYMFASNFWSELFIIAGVIFLIFYSFVKAIRYGHPDSQDRIQLPDQINLFFKYFHPSQNDFTATFMIFFGALTFISTIVYLAIFFMFLWVMISWLSLEKGEEHAQESKKKFVSDGCIYQPSTSISSCIKVIDAKGTTVHEGLLIALHGRRFAVFTNNGPIISDLPEGAQLVRAFSKGTYSDNQQ
ncbi:hypothetical protein [Neptuniibacter sp. QD37_11]|uniref:hypothetical protein n=1 Tax=Neptuniibacter sp. QD37_11 TaxID=3398209 RepID=UPI0039F62C28